jgi:SSS family solute:Na+ symporter
MSAWDWLLVIVLNGAIIGWGFKIALGGVRSSSEWFLAGRGLPWWIIGISMYATAIDASDLVADSGGTYTLGFSYFVTNMVGATTGWALAAFIVFLPMYRAGMYTNAEYLEARFGPSVRVLCALVQVQYRTLVLGIIGCSLFWTLKVLCDWSYATSMTTVVGVAVVASIYTAMGGLKSVAITDALQFVVMTVAALVIWSVVYQQVDGWNGVRVRLAESEPGLENLLRVGRQNVALVDVSDRTPLEIERQLLVGGEYREQEQVIARITPGWLVAISFFILGLTYPIVNHTQSMRMFAAKTEWDFKMCAFLASIIMIVMSFFNLSMGILGRAVAPDVSVLPGGNQDQIYPYLVSQIDVIGLKGLVVAGIFAAAFSTYDSIGSSLAALLTRDVYARLLVRDRDDGHYLRVGQWLTPAIIGISFIYMPILLRGGMLLFFLEVTNTFVTPLLTVFLMGTMTSVGRQSGLIGLLTGATYGVVRLCAPWIAEQFGITVLPPFAANPFAAYPISMAVTATAMLLVSLVTGWWSPEEELRQDQEGWLRASQTSVREIAVAGLTRRSQLMTALPSVLAIGVVLIGWLLCFVVWW